MTNLFRQWAGNILRPDLRAKELVMQSASDQRVISGAFKGMRYLRVGETQEAFTARSYMSRLLGTYELELREAINDLISRPVDVIFNIGAAEGYYAVGLALRCPQAKVIAFEVEDHTRLNRMIEINDVQDRVIPYGFCDMPALNEQLQMASHPAIVIDVEGAERDLLDPVAAPKLRSAIILVEVHEFIDPALYSLIKERFEATHTIQEIQARPRTLDDFPLPINVTDRWIPERYLLRLLHETRPQGMRWFYMIPSAS